MIGRWFREARLGAVVALVALAVVLPSATAGAALHAYDMPTVVRVDVHRHHTDEARTGHLGDVPWPPSPHERSASPPARAYGPSTPFALRSVAVEAGSCGLEKGAAGRTNTATPDDPNPTPNATEAATSAKGGVYTLTDEAGTVTRTGRSNDLGRRALEHGRTNPELDFNPVHYTDDLATQRGLEQVVYNQNPTSWPVNGGLNKIRPISVNNPRIIDYENAAANFLYGPR